MKQNSARVCTLCLFLKEDQILLAMKKRGFGAGRWNGVGGKLEKGETPKQAAIREAQEEINITPKKVKKVAILNFDFPDKVEWSQQVVVFTCQNWEGEPAESEEMNPKWFGIKEIPYDQMWPDDIHWLPKVLAGTTVLGKFIFDPQQKLLEFEVAEKQF